MTISVRELSSMRPSKILKKTSRRKKKKSGNGFQYRKIAAAARKRAIDRLFGSQGPASPIRKIDPKTGQVMAIIEAH